MSNNHYIYLHRRLTGRLVPHKQAFDIFYIGQGKGLAPTVGLYPSELKGYSKSRAFQHHAGRRSAQWFRTTKKYGYIVELLFTDLTKIVADELECRLIAFYGMNNLVNKTIGGEGASGVVVTAETREKLRRSTIARRGRAVLCTTTNELFETATHAAKWLLEDGKVKSLQSGQTGVGKVCLGQLSGFRGFGFKFVDGSTPPLNRAVPAARNMPEYAGVAN